MAYKKRHTVTIYTSPTSPFCTLAKDYFREHGIIEFYEFDISHHPEAAHEMFVKTGQMSTPVIEIDGRVIIGYRPDVMDTILKDETGANREQAAL
jgi:glutaredoxin 3